FREHYNYFPDVIYYLATDQEIEELKAKYPADFSTSDVMRADTSKADMTSAIEKPIQRLKDELKQVRGQMSRSKEEIQQKIRDALQEQSKAHQDQMKELKESSDNHIKALHLQMQNALEEQNRTMQESMRVMQEMLSTVLKNNPGASSSS
ncbi:hypothetical protein BGZ51_007812, partial [Haplosporangium sp. Z 767]